MNYIFFSNKRILFLLLIIYSIQTIKNYDIVSEPILTIPQTIVYFGNLPSLYVIQNSSSFNNTLYYSLRFGTTQQLSSQNIDFTIYNNPKTNFTYSFLETINYDKKTSQFSHDVTDDGIYRYAYLISLNNTSEYIIFKIPINAKNKIIAFSAEYKMISMPTEEEIKNIVYIVIIVLVCIFVMIIGCVIFITYCKHRSQFNKNYDNLMPEQGNILQPMN